MFLEKQIIIEYNWRIMWHWRLE